jgi:quinol monooxygenase YgiN
MMSPAREEATTMTQLYVQHKVEEYAKWRAVFDEMTSVRAATGSTGYHVFRNAADPNEIVILSEFPNVDQARLYAQSPDLRQAMQRAGVTSQPIVLFLEEA